MPIEAGIEPMRSTLSSSTLPLFLLMLLAYWEGARAGAALVNQRRPARRYGGRTLGVALGLVLA